MVPKLNIENGTGVIDNNIDNNLEGDDDSIKKMYLNESQNRAI